MGTDMGIPSSERRMPRGTPTWKRKASKFCDSGIPDCAGKKTTSAARSGELWLNDVPLMFWQCRTRGSLKRAAEFVSPVAYASVPFCDESGARFSLFPRARGKEPSEPETVSEIADEGPKRVFS